MKILAMEGLTRKEPLDMLCLVLMYFLSIQGAPQAWHIRDGYLVPATAILPSGNITHHTTKIIRINQKPS